MKIALLLTCLFLVVLGQQVDLMLVVGDVTPNKARILYESSESPERILHIRLLQGDMTLQDQQVIAIDRPKVIEFTNLRPDTEYNVYFDDERVTFKTISSSPFKTVVLSCDRFVDDKDEEFFKELVQNQQYDVAIHMGDQIYADIIGKNAANKTFEELTEEFRDLYRKTWNTPTKAQFLRRGSHVMIPDDHDITNNLDADLIGGPMDLVLKAGRQAYYEYQHQLHENIYDPSGKFIIYKDVWYFKRIGQVAFAFLDTRFERTFNFDNSSRLLGSKQFQDLKTHLEDWKDVKNWFLVSSVPLGFFTKTMAEIAYKFENPRERYPSQSFLLPSLLEILDLLLPYNNIQLIAGDVHQFVKSRICHSSGKCIIQLVASGMTSGSSVIGEFKLLSYFAFGKHFTSHKIGNWTLNHDEQFIDNNYGVVAVESSGDYEWYGKFRIVRNFDTLWKNLYFSYFQVIAFMILALIAFGVNNYFLFKKR